MQQILPRQLFLLEPNFPVYFPHNSCIIPKYYASKHLTVFGTIQNKCKKIGILALQGDRNSLSINFSSRLNFHNNHCIKNHNKIYYHFLYIMKPKRWISVGKQSVTQLHHDPTFSMHLVKRRESKSFGMATVTFYFLPLGGKNDYIIK